MEAERTVLQDLMSVTDLPWWFIGCAIGYGISLGVSCRALDCGTFSMLSCSTAYASLTSPELTESPSRSTAQLHNRDGSSTDVETGIVVLFAARSAAYYISPELLVSIHWSYPG